MQDFNVGDMVLFNYSFDQKQKLGIIVRKRGSGNNASYHVVHPSRLARQDAYIDLYFIDKHAQIRSAHE